MHSVGHNKLNPTFKQVAHQLREAFYYCSFNGGLAMLPVLDMHTFLCSGYLTAGEVVSVEQTKCQLTHRRFDLRNYSSDMQALKKSYCIHFHE